MNSDTDIPLTVKEIVKVKQINMSDCANTIYSIVRLLQLGESHYCGCLQRAEKKNPCPLTAGKPRVLLMFEARHHARYVLALSLLLILKLLEQRDALLLLLLLLALSLNTAHKRRGER